MQEKQRKGEKNRKKIEKNTLDTKDQDETNKAVSPPTFPNLQQARKSLN